MPHDPDSEIIHGRKADVIGEGQGHMVQQVLLRAAAKRIGDVAAPVGKRAKHDLTFCNRLAPLIFARTSRLCNDIRNAVVSKIAVHYELTKSGITHSQVRFKVRHLLRNQHGDTEAPVAGSAPIVKPLDDDAASAKYFKTSRPYLAPIIPEVVYEVWYASKTGLGRRHGDDMISHRADRPDEKELPDPMMCLVSANVLVPFSSIVSMLKHLHIEGALLAWSSGRHVPDAEFSQSRLEGICKSRVDTIADQRSASPKGFHKIMHDLSTAPRSVLIHSPNSRSQFTSVKASASAKKVDIDEDSE
ncbi:hypothetical protein B0H13DRAFT_1850154 [Mycena leptocephala]|nr:hypothetical protein B0H13DRAFT_1850154 [Mycena leptocephala]